MGTRCGAIDAGALLYLLRRKLYDDKSLQHLLYEESGLKGLSGISNDVRALLASARARGEAGDRLFRLPDRLFRWRLHGSARRSRRDCLHRRASARTRRSIRAGGRANSWPGSVSKLDESANSANGPLISTKQSKVRAWVIPTNEEIMIARHTLALIDGQ